MIMMSQMFQTYHTMNKAQGKLKIHCKSNVRYRNQIIRNFSIFALKIMISVFDTAYLALYAQ